MDNIPVSVNIFDKNGKRIFVNSFFYHLAGKDSSRGFTSELTTDGTRKNEYLYEKINLALKEGKISEVFNYSYKSRSTTTRRFLDFIVGPLRDLDGEIIGAYSIAKDGTARHLAKQKLLKLNATLEKRVKERTDELTLANAKLKKLSNEKGVLISNIAHEIKTILTIIRGNLDLLALEDQGASPLKIECNEEVKREIERMSKIVSELVSVSRSEVYANSLQLETFNLVSLINELVGSYRIIAKNKKITIQLKKTAIGQITLRADKAKIITLVSNLIENSLKFGREKGKLEILIKQDKNDTRIFFKDDGCGIEKHMLEYVTEPFFQVEKTTGGNIEKRGFGLGLAICQKIVSAHGGVLKAGSEGLGKGATFVVTFPRNSNLK